MSGDTGENGNVGRVKFVKAACLIVLTLQNALLALTMRYSKIRSSEPFLDSTAVVCTEILKLAISLAVYYAVECLSPTHFFKSLHSTILKQPYDNLKVSVVSITYVIQNNLLYLSVTYLDTATYQVTYQLKILTTALFAVTLLHKKLQPRQWVALLVLTFGVILVNFSDAKDTRTHSSQYKWIGIAAALSACFLSGFSGIFFEKILKGSDTSVWLRNVQLSLLSIPAGLLHAAIRDWNSVQESGFFQGYDSFLWFMIFLQAFGGLLTGLVVKYADNILKGFACSLAIVVGCVCSMFFFNFRMNKSFIAGAWLVISSIFLYSVPSPIPAKPYNNLIQKA